MLIVVKTIGLQEYQLPKSQLFIFKAGDEERNVNYCASDDIFNKK